MHTSPHTMGFPFLLLIVTVTVTTAAAASPATPTNIIHLLMPHSGSGGHKHSSLDCLSWRLAVETNNFRGKYVPEECEEYVGHYMYGSQYRNDCELVAGEAYEYAKGLNLTGDGKDIWVFDIDETTLSNLPYYARDTVAFGALPYNATAFDEWVEEASAPAIPSSLELYKKLIKLGFKIVFLTGTNAAYSKQRTQNMKAIGYTTWEKIIYKKPNEGSAMVYKQAKRKALEESGYRIRGNTGDQWSDLLGSNPGDRTFKVPDPIEPNDGSGLVYKEAKRKALEDSGYRIRGNMGDQWSDLLGSNPGDRIFKVPDPMYYIA